MTWVKYIPEASRDNNFACLNSPNPRSGQTRSRILLKLTRRPCRGTHVHGISVFPIQNSMALRLTIGREITRRRGVCGGSRSSENGVKRRLSFTEEIVSEEPLTDTPDELAPKAEKRRNIKSCFHPHSHTKAKDIMPDCAEHITYL